jgi:hypothetical protein
MSFLRQPALVGTLGAVAIAALPSRAVPAVTKGIGARAWCARALALVACVLLSLPLQGTAYGRGPGLVSTGPLAVLVSRPCRACGPGGSFGYIMALVDAAGHVVAWASATGERIALARLFPQWGRPGGLPSAIARSRW